MNENMRFGVRAACIGLVLAVGACSGGNPLTTSALLGGSAKKELPPPPPETMTDRVLHVATTSARAQRCGYVFDPAGVRQGYLAFEAQQGTAGDQLAKAEKSYDYTVATVSKSIAANADYCSDEQTSVIKRDLTQVLAGDFSSPAKKATADVGWWSAKKSEAPIDREKLFKPTR